MDWSNLLIKRGGLDSPVVEANPVVWQDRLLLVERWTTRWDDPPEDPPRGLVRLREDGTDHIEAQILEGYGLCSAIVHDGRLYVFASSQRADVHGKLGPNTIDVTHTTDLASWSHPQVAIPQDEDGTLYNQTVCCDGEHFVMAYETRAGVPFTSKFAESDDLLTWRRLPEAIHGLDRYAACPCLRFVGGYYYMLYLARPTEAWWFETWLTRSKDLVHWEEAPHNPVIAPDPDRGIYHGCPEHAEARGCRANGKEINASDPDLVEWRGKTRVYFTGGCQHECGDLQVAEFDGPAQALFESYYE